MYIRYVHTHKSFSTILSMYCKQSWTPPHGKDLYMINTAVHITLYATFTEFTCIHLYINNKPHNFI